MLERILIAGSGGQGIVLAGKILATAAVQQVPHVTFFPAYGAEVRGGTSNCQVILSSGEIASPTAEQFDTLILMNAESMDRYLALRAPDSLVLANSSLCNPPEGEGVVPVPATNIADGMGNARAANLIMLGILLSRKPMVTSACVEQELQCIFSRKSPVIMEMNLRAFRAGLQYHEE
jgi:2-oxoglutarate ferredoxin oxidoreductase subunit gamma